MSSSLAVPTSRPKQGLPTLPTQKTEGERKIGDVHPRALLTGFKILHLTPMVLELADGRIAKAEMQTFGYDGDGVTIDYMKLGFHSIRDATRDLQNSDYKGRIDHLYPQDFDSLPISKEELEKYLALNVRFVVFERYMYCESILPLFQRKPKELLADIENRD